MYTATNNIRRPLQSVERTRSFSIHLLHSSSSIHHSLPAVIIQRQQHIHPYSQITYFHADHQIIEFCAFDELYSMTMSTQSQFHVYALNRCCALIRR